MTCGRTGTSPTGASGRSKITILGKGNGMEWVRNILEETWDISARITPLAGEFDLNFLAETDTGARNVLKIMREACDTQLLDMQIA